MMGQLSRVYSQAMLPEIGIGLIAGLVVGWVIAWALGQAKIASLSAELKAEKSRAANESATLTAAREALSNEFKALAGQALSSNNDSFLTLAKQELGRQQETANNSLEAKETAITNLLTSAKTALESLQSTTQDIEGKRERAYGAVLAEIQNIQNTHQSLRRETAQLVQALRAPKTRGNWGQLQLQRCIEFAGMVEHASFDLEVHVRTDDVTLRPDCVVYLPNGRTIIVDAKTPLDAFLEAADETTDEATRALRLAAHAASVRGHMKQLSDKNYCRQFKDSPDFVVCFLPTEALFSAALEQDPGLIEFGSNSNIILATPTTLIALLKAVAYGWQQMEITRNALAIKETGQKLYDKLAIAQDYFSKMGRALENTVGQYNNLIGCIEGRDSVFDRARELHQLAIGQNELGELKTLDPEKSKPRILKGKDWTTAPLNGTLRELAASTEEDGD